MYYVRTNSNSTSSVKPAWCLSHLLLLPYSPLCQYIYWSAIYSAAGSVLLIINMLVITTKGNIKTQTCSPLRNRIKLCFQSEVVHSTSRTSHGHLDSLIVPYLLSSILAHSTVPNSCCEAHSVISLVEFPSAPALPTPPARTETFSQTPKLLNTCSLFPNAQHLSSLPWTAHLLESQHNSVRLWTLTHCLSSLYTIF